MIRGWPESIFKDQRILRQKAYRCGRRECGLILKNAWQLECGHRYCKDCLDLIASEEKFDAICLQCITDRLYDDDPGGQLEMTAMPLQAHIEFTKARPDSAAERELGRLRVCCPYCDASTDGKGVIPLKLKNLQEHIDCCPQQPTTCGKCQQVYEFIHSQQHEEEECLHREIQCPSTCGVSDLLFKDLDAHRAVCRKKAVPAVCRLCRTAYTSSLHKHLLNECFAPCPLGCSNGGPVPIVSHLEEHQTVHALFILSELFGLIDSRDNEQAGLMELVDNMCGAETNPSTYSHPLRDGIDSMLTSDPGDWLPNTMDLSSFVTSNSGEDDSWDADSDMTVVGVGEEESSSELSSLTRELTEMEQGTLSRHHILESELQTLAQLTSSERKARLNHLVSSLGAAAASSSQIERLNDQLSALDGDVHLLGSSKIVAEKTSAIAAQVDESLTNRISNLEREAAMAEAALTDLSMLLSHHQQTTYNGYLLWKIKGVQTLREQARQSNPCSIFSPPFYSDVYGYKMCLRIYLNGDGVGKGSHVSLYFVVMRGDYDPILSWPFQHKVTMAIKNQTGAQPDVVERFAPDVQSSSFQKPVNNCNVASGCPQFASQAQIFSVESGFVLHDDIFVEVGVAHHQ